MNIHATVKAGDTDALKGMLELGTNVNARDLAEYPCTLLQVRGTPRCWKCCSRTEPE